MLRRAFLKIASYYLFEEHETALFKNIDAL